MPFLILSRLNACCNFNGQTQIKLQTPGMDDDSYAWATASLSPKLEIKLTGVTTPDFNFDISDKEFKKQVVHYHKDIVRIMGNTKKRECGFAPGGECHLISADARQWKASSEKFGFLYGSNPNVDFNLRAAFAELSMLAISLIQNDQKWVVIKTLQIQDDLARYEEAKKEALKNPKKSSEESKPLSPEEFKKFLAAADKEDKLRKAKAMKREKAQPNLGITVEQFESRYNRFLSDYAADGGDAPLNVIKASVIPGVKMDTMVACPTKRTCIVAPVFKHTKKLQKIMVNGTTDRTKESIRTVLWNMIISCSAAAITEKKYDDFRTVADVALEETESLSRGEGYEVTYQPHPAYGPQIVMTRDRH